MLQARKDVHGASSSSSTVVVVTEEMVTEAARAGDLEQLREWARQGVQVRTGEPLLIVAKEGSIEVAICLVQELHADVNQVVLVGRGTHTALIDAASNGYLDMVRCLVELGAEVGLADNYGDTAMLESACFGHYSTVQFLLEYAGADIEEVNNAGERIWDYLFTHFVEKDGRLVEEDRGYEDDTAALTALLRVLVLRDAPPPDLVVLLSSAPDGHFSDRFPPNIDPEHIAKRLSELVLPERVIQEGLRLRARLPAYLVRRRALLDAHCSILPPLRALVHGYMELTTTEEIWATGLGTAPPPLRLTPSAPPLRSLYVPLILSPGRWLRYPTLALCRPPFTENTYKYSQGCGQHRSYVYSTGRIHRY
jgi:hypothetical protein